MPTFFPTILSSKQKGVLGKLTMFQQNGCYLAGGTALALQLGHRTSLDFYFYTPQKIENNDIVSPLQQAFSSLEISNLSEGTVQIVASGVNLSLFYYPYPLVDHLLDFPPIKLASLQDIAAMKVIAVIQRAKQRDFWDLYYLIRRLGLSAILQATYKKYPWYEENSKILLKALTYFYDADKDQEVNRIRIFDQTLQWNGVKQLIAGEVRKLA